MPSFDPSSSVPEFVHVIRRVYLDTQDMGNGRDLVRSKVVNRFSLPYI
jgi:hypothetical protein